MDIVEKITPEIFNATFSWQVNAVYHEIINCEIIKPQYSNKKKQWHFAVQKRKWYRRLNADLRWYSVTDVERIYRWWCNKWDYDLFFYTISKDWTKYSIRRAVNTDCEADPNSISNWCACACWFNKFMRTKHVSWDPRIITTNSNSRQQTGVIYNKLYTDTWLVNEDGILIVDCENKQLTLKHELQHKTMILSHEIMYIALQHEKWSVLHHMTQ